MSTEALDRENDMKTYLLITDTNNLSHISSIIESKKELKKKMFIIIIEIILLFIAYIIYFALTITFNISFDNSIVDTIDYIYLFTNRGWVFSNFIYFYREMLISISNNQTVSSYDNSPLYTNNSQEYTHKDLFHLYMTKSYSIESDILLLTNEFLKGYNNDILKGVVQQERELNSEQYCSILKSYDNEFVTDDYCNEYYSMNNGIKDNIQIITSYIQTHIPNYDNKTIEEMKEYLSSLYGFTRDNRIFMITKSYLHKEMTRGAKKAGVKRITIHGLRHSHISYLINRGFSAVAIGNRVGHESQSITFHYAHMFPTEQQEMAAVLNREFCERTGSLEKGDDVK